MRTEPSTWLCDACVTVPPAWRYDIPPGTRLITTLNTLTGKVDELRSAGGFGLCDDCRKIVDSGVDVAARLATRMVRQLADAPKATRVMAKAAALSMFRRVVPLFSNPRPAVRGEDPTDATITHFDGAPAPNN